MEHGVNECREHERPVSVRGCSSKELPHAVLPGDQSVTARSIIPGSARRRMKLRKENPFPVRAGILVWPRESRGAHHGRIARYRPGRCAGIGEAWLRPGRYL